MVCPNKNLSYEISVQIKNLSNEIYKKIVYVYAIFYTYKIIFYT